MISHLVCARSIVKMWHKLEPIFLTSYGSQVMDLILQLQTFKKGDLNVEVYVLRIKIVVDHLATISQLVPDCDLVFYVFGNSGAKWNSLIPRIASNSYSISFGELYSHLLSHERILEHQSFGFGSIQANNARFLYGSSKPLNGLQHKSKCT